MIKQMFKLVWNRKRTNILIIIEIFFSFLVLFAVMAFSVNYANNYRRPLGFSYDNVWSISVGSIFDSYGREGRAGAMDDYKQMEMALRDFPEIDAIAGVSMLPFQIGKSSSNIRYKDRAIETLFNDGTDELKDVLGLTIVQGRWFKPSDDAMNYQPVVINERLRDEMFGSEDPLGKELYWPTGPKREDQIPRRIVGVITDFRQHGEFHDPYNYVFFRAGTSHSRGSTRALATSLAMVNILIRVHPGIPAAFEEKVMARLRAVVKDRTIQIEPLARARKSHVRLVLGPIIAGGLVAVFLIIMVGLGMVGVLWQSVSRRTKEIGLRRAVGGTARSIHLQVLGELLVVASVGLLFGVAVVIQLPLLEIVNWFSSEIYLASICISVFLMYALTILAGLYPGWLATKVQPASALHYE